MSGVNDELLIELLVSSGLVQYPDARLYNAATLLPADERPTVPARIKPKMEGEAYYHPQDAAIYVGAKGTAYRDKKLRRLAAVLAHEGVHSRGEADERPAYQKQHEVLRRLGETDEGLLQVLLDRALGKPIVIGATRKE